MKNSEQMELLGLTLSPPDSPVRTSQSPGKEQELKVSGQDYSMKSLDLLATLEKPDSLPSSWYWRTSQLSLIEDWERFLSGWSRSGMTVNGIAYQLPTLAHRTGGIGGGAYATPTTMDSLPPKSPEALEREATIARPGRSRPANLRDQISNSHLWPTPTTQESEHPQATLTSTGRRETKDGQGSHGLNLADSVKMWPTPTSRDYKDTLNSRPNKQEHLLDRVRQNMWPTPRANSAMSATITPESVWKENRFPNLETVVGQRLWPTPTVSDTEGGLVKNVEEKDGSFSRVNKQGVRWGVKLKDAVAHTEKMWPTPTANEDAAGTPDGKMQKMLGNHPSIRGETPQEWAEGSLNPTWVSWLMGYPLDWLDLDGFQNPELEGLPPEYLTEPPD